MSSPRLRALVTSLLTVAAVGATVLVAAPPASAALPDIHFARAIERLAPYQGQSTCSPTVKPGTAALRSFVMKAFPGTRDSGITRACSIGGRSEHKEGRAWDWGVRYSVTSERVKAAAFLSWLRKTDSYGNRFANARRLGVQYVIWNRHIWSSYQADAGWRAYTGSDPHTSHIHISLSWPGALKKTSFFTRGVPYNFPATPPPSSGGSGDTGSGGSGGYSGGEGDNTHGPGTGVTVKYPEPQPQPAPDPVPAGAILEDEMLTLPATFGSGVASKGLLQAGADYRITVKGVYGYGGGWADAECSNNTYDKTWRRNRSIALTHPDWDTLDAYLNGRDLYSKPTIDTGRGCNLTNHTYSWDFTSAVTDKARLRIWDPIGYGDNKGQLVAHVVRLSPLWGTGSGPGTGSDDDFVTAPTTFSVDSASQTGTATALRVQAGHSYRVTMTGSYAYGGGEADAECSTTTEDSRWRRTRDWGITTGDGDLLDLKLGDGTDPTSSTASGSSCDPVTHTYSWTWTPHHDQVLRAFVYDTDYSDNRGAITVTVVPA